MNGLFSYLQEDMKNNASFQALQSIIDDNRSDGMPFIFRVSFSGNGRGVSARSQEDVCPRQIYVQEGL